MFNRLMIAAAAVVLTTPLAVAGPVDSACMRSERAAGNGQLCGCIQQVADMTLRGSDQRRAAKLMKDPDLAHEVWVSKRGSDDAFWERYKAFGQQAEAYCAR